MSATPTFGRYAEIPVDQMTAEQKEGYRFLVEGPRGRLPGPYKVWVHNPRLLRAAAPLGEHWSSTSWRPRSPTAGSCLRGSTTARSRRSATRASPTWSC